MLFESFPQGYGGRWAFGTTILVYLIAFNESSGSTVIFSSLLATFYSILSATCKSAVKQLQIPYIRASNKFDFVCLFLGVWMDILAILTTCAALARTLSTCLDAMTGGLARILILGRNSPPYEPWPDVIGVGVVLLVTGMFMLGLENTKVFSMVMMLGMFGVNAILTITSWLSGNYDEWKKDNYLQPEGAKSFFVSAALLTFSYPSEMSNKQGWRRLIGWILIFMVCLASILAGACLSMMIHQKSNKEYHASPFFTVLDENNFHKLIPAVACLLLLASSGAFLELFQELYSIVVRLATSEWKILIKQISYESPDSGNPVLAIFIAGSLCAMLAFACPLQFMTHILAASHLCAGLLRAFYLLYAPFRPRFMQQSNDSSSLSYSRLSTAPTSAMNPSLIRRKNNWTFNLPIQNAIKKSKSKTLTKKKKEVEKEWLLLGEPSSPRPVQSSEQHNDESTVFSDPEIPMSDNDFVESLENSESDSDTDIDAIVDEYRQKIKVTTAGPMEKSVRIPSMASWKITIFAIVVIIFGIGLTIAGIYLKIMPAYITGTIGIMIVSIIMSFIPKHSGNGIDTAPPVICAMVLTLGSILLSFCLAQSWPAIIFWIISGFLIVLRCDKWCCSCLDQSSDMQPIIPNVSGKSTTVRIPRPPKALIVPGKLPGQNR